jgi:hypothetical protein
MSAAHDTRRIHADQVQAVAHGLRHDGFVFQRAPEAAAMLGIAAADWQEFAASWNDLGVDTYMADGGRYRKRRHAAFAVASGPRGAEITRKPHQPHYQSRDYNALNGGIARWFDPVTEATANGPALAAILHTCADVFAAVAAPPAKPWHVEIHQFRIEARTGQVGQPTPEGAHRDGVDYVLVLLINRQNIASGETTISDLNRTSLGSFTLTHPADAAWVDDHRVFHGVTPVQALDPTQPAHRDVLVVTFRAED